VPQLRHRKPRPGVHLSRVDSRFCHGTRNVPTTIRPKSGHCGRTLDCGLTSAIIDFGPTGAESVIHNMLTGRWERTVAKAKSTNSGKSQANSRARRKTIPPAAAPPAPSAEQLTTIPRRELSTESIGNVAGDVWGFLSQNGGQTLAAIKKSVDAPADVVVAAVGWLAREDKLEFATSGRQVKISLR
jgi:Winged helix-turn-helix domain (DUF2582)